MTFKPAIALFLLLLSACQPLTSMIQYNNGLSQDREDTCQIPVNEVLSCIIASKKLSTQETTLEFDSLITSLKQETDNSKIIRLLCLSLQHNSSKEQLQEAKTTLEKIFKDARCKQQDLTGLLFIVQGKIDLHKQYLDKNWLLYLETKEIRNKREKTNQELNDEIISYQRRIEDLEQQVQKLKEIESMLDKTVRP